jgi:hypothetical protein
MKHQRHFDPSDSALREASQIATLIGDLDRLVRILECDAATEEQRARVFDPHDPAYPVLARSLVARRENIKNTIAALERRLADRPDEAELVRLMAMANNS